MAPAARLSRKQRLQVKTEIVAALEANEWSWERTSALFADFGVSWPDDWQGVSYYDLLGELSDPDLVELYSIALDIEVDEAQESYALAAESAVWKTDYTRVFLSHAGSQAEHVAAVAQELAVVGVDGFVAHETMQFSIPWQAQIEDALRTMQAFVAFVDPSFNESAWCKEEVGWALGRQVPCFAIRQGADPDGFLSHQQWPSAPTSPPQPVARLISQWIAGLPGIGNTMFEALVAALGTAGNYMDAGATASRIAAMGTLSDAQFERIDSIWWTNDQLYGGALPSKALKPLYQQNHRAWPPPKRDDLNP